MSFAQSLIIYFISPMISAYIFLVVAYVIMGWLANFGVVNMRHPQVRQIYNILHQISSYSMDPIKRVLPSFGGLDFSPLVVIFGLTWFDRFVLWQKLMPMLG